MYNTKTQFQTAANRQQIIIGVQEDLDKWERIRDQEIDENFGYGI